MREVIGVDFYNLALTGGVAMTVRAKTGDNEHTPCVMIRREHDGRTYLIGKQSESRNDNR